MLKNILKNFIINKIKQILKISRLSVNEKFIEKLKSILWNIFQKIKKWFYLLEQKQKKSKATFNTKCKIEE